MDNSKLIEQLRAARVLSVQVGHITFTGECPLYAKLMGIIAKCRDTVDSADAEMAAAAITGWDGMTEADILPGGDSSKLIQFDRELFDTLIRDRADWWTPISMKITESVMSRQAVKESEAKNSQAGTTRKRSKD